MYPSAEDDPFPFYGRRLMSILKRGKGRYLVRLFMGRDPVTGKELRRGKTIKGTRKQAEQFEREWTLAYERGQLLTDATLTLNQHIEAWKENSLRADVSPRTFEAYSYDLKRFTKDSIGRLPISKIRPLDLQNFYHQLVNNGTGPSSVKRLHAAMSKLFKNALVLQLIAHNPTVGVEVPGRDKIVRRPKKPMEPEVATQFLDAAGQTPWFALFELAMSSGMRPGEYLGLPWSCVDWDGELIRVEQAVKRPRGKAPYIGPPKTRQSRRVIPVPSQVLDSLREHRIAQNEHRLRVGGQWYSELDLVFPNSQGGIWDESDFTAAFRKVCALANLKGFQPYSLRHTCATLLLLSDENIKVISERLGHSSISQTLDTYSHVLPTMQKSASEKLARLLFKQS